MFVRVLGDDKCIHIIYMCAIDHKLTHSYTCFHQWRVFCGLFRSELLSKYTAPNDEDVQHDILHKVTTYCGKKVTNHTLDKYVDPYQWTFYHSVFFAFTVCSTLGRSILKWDTDKSR